MKRLVPYGIRLGADGKISTWPVVHAAFRSPNGRGAALILVVDSGATVTLLPSIDARELGIRFAAGKRAVVQGATGGVVVGYRHELAMTIEGFQLRSIPVVFLEGSAVPRVLGREGVFEHFGILFDEARRRIGLLERRSERRAIERLLASTPLI